MTNCLKFIEMQKMFHGKFVEIANVVEIQIITTNVNVVDANVATKSKTTE